MTKRATPKVRVRQYERKAPATKPKVTKADPAPSLGPGHAVENLRRAVYGPGPKGA